MMSLQSSNQDSSLDGEKAEKEDRPFFTPLDPIGGAIQMKNILATTTRSREKYTITVSGKLLRTPSVGSILPEHTGQRMTIQADKV